MDLIGEPQSHWQKLRVAVIIFEHLGAIRNAQDARSASALMVDRYSAALRMVYLVQSAFKRTCPGHGRAIK
jgi:energy-coupling factor transporter transmembrane protein EcfT